MSFDDFKRTYELSPIILVGGIAANLTGGMLPVIYLTQANDFSSGILSGANPDSFLAHFEPMPGGTLENIQVGTYPFANQRVAGNSIIFEPLTLSLLMTAPAPTSGGYSAKLQSFTSLKKSLDQHMLMGGMFTVATPAYIYTPGLLTSLRDVTPAAEKQKQALWQWDFLFPLLSQSDATQAYNALIGKMQNGTQIAGDPPSAGGTINTTGNPNVQAGPPIAPANAGAGASSVSPQSYSLPFSSFNGGG